jgi:hypothetical protein
MLIASECAAVSPSQGCFFSKGLASEVGGRTGTTTPGVETTDRQSNSAIRRFTGWRAATSL